MSELQDASVLIVDDEADIRDTLKEYLSDHGFTAACASGVDQAFVMLNAGYSPKLILLDFNMPRISGGEMLKMLKADERYRHIPVVMMSIYDMHIFPEAETYIDKPFDVTRLKRILNKYCSEV